MQPFLASLRNELFKLRKRKKYLVFLIIGALICVGSALRVVLANLVLDEEIPRNVLLGGLAGENLWFLLLLFLPLMALMGCCDLFAGEQADHTVRFSLMRPVGKGKLFFSKAAADVLGAHGLGQGRRMQVGRLLGDHALAQDARFRREEAHAHARGNDL